MLPGAALERLYRELARGFDMVFVVGTTAVFPYIAEPVMRAVHASVPTVEINPARTHLSDRVRYYVPERAAAALPEIVGLAGEPEEGRGA